MTQEAPMNWGQLSEYIEGLKELPADERLSKLREANQGLTNNPHSGNWTQVRKRIREIIEEQVGIHGREAIADWDPHHGRRNSQEPPHDPNSGREEPPPIPDPSQEPDIEAQGLPTFMLIALRFTRDQITSDKAISEITKLAGIAASAVAQAALLVILTKLRERNLSNSDAEAQIQQLAIEHPAVEPEQPEVDPEKDPPQKPKEGDVSDHDHNNGPDAGRTKGGDDARVDPPTKNRGEYPENPFQARVRVEHDAARGLISGKNKKDLLKQVDAEVAAIQSSHELPKPSPKAADENKDDDDAKTEKPAPPKKNLFGRGNNGGDGPKEPTTRNGRPVPDHDRNQNTTSNGRNWWPLVAVLGIIALVAIVAIIALTRDDGDGNSSSSSSSSSSSGGQSTGSTTGSTGSSTGTTTGSSGSGAAWTREAKCEWLRANFPQTTDAVQSLGARLANVQKARITVHLYPCDPTNTVFDGFIVNGPNEGYQGEFTLEVPTNGAVDAYPGAKFSGANHQIGAETIRATDGKVTAVRATYWPFNDDNPPTSGGKPSTSATTAATTAATVAATTAPATGGCKLGSALAAEMGWRLEPNQPADVTKYGGAQVTLDSTSTLPSGWEALTSGQKIAGGDSDRMMLKGTWSVYPPNDGKCRQSLGVSS